MTAFTVSEWNEFYFVFFVYECHKMHSTSNLWTFSHCFVYCKIFDTCNYAVTFTTNAFSALTLLAGWQEGHPACRNLSGGMLMSGAWCRFAYDPADATATHFLLLQ